MNNLTFEFISQFSFSTGSTRLRIISIFNYLKSIGYTSVFSNNVLTDADIFVFQKGNLDFIKPKFDEVYKKRKFIIFDVDDWYGDYYNELIKKSDMVFVSSLFLKKKLKKLNTNIIFLDAPLDITNLNISLAKFNLKNPKIGWFGNIMNLPALKKTGIKEVTTITKGGDIEWSQDTIDEKIKKFDLIVLPQDKSMYGLAKGNNRMLKSIYLGVPCLISDLDAYVSLARLLDYPRKFVVKDGESWKEKIKEIKSGKIKFDFDFGAARKKILDHYSVEVRSKSWLNYVIFYYNHRKFFKFIKYICRILTVFRKEKIENKRILVFFGYINFTYQKRKNSI